MSALLTFLGGSAFRMLWGEASAWLKARQDHKHEIELQKLQAQFEAEAHERRQSEIRLQHELGVKTIAVQAEADLARIDSAGFYSAALAGITAKSGVAWVDAFNQLIRPGAASVAIFVWVVAMNRAGWVMTDWDRELIGAILGFFFANRVIAMRGRVD